MSPAPESLTLHCRGLQVAAQRYPGTGARRVLALHGWLDNAHSFRRLAPLLPEVELVAVDLPGHGLSQHHSADAHYHFMDWVGNVMDIAQALGWERFTLMGHSMGAGIATLVAGAYPMAIDSLVLLDGLGPFSSHADDVPERMAKHRLQVARLEARQAPIHASRAALAETLCKVVPHLSHANALLLLERGAVDVDAAAGGPGARSRNDPRLRATSLFFFTEAQVAAFLQRIACPSLLLRPTDGFQFDPEILASRLRLIRQLAVVSLGGGHHVHLEQPETVAPHLQAFWRGVDGQARAAGAAAESLPPARR